MPGELPVVAQPEHLHDAQMLKSKLQNGAGARNTWVVVEDEKILPDPTTHEAIRSYHTYCERWAEELITSGREFVAAFQVQPILQGILKLPYDDRTKGITPKMRLRIGTRVLNFAGVWDEGGAHEKIVLWCVEPVES